jgi:ubiquinone/menaquinone biosynthesis C-methylase UbiE
MAETEFRFNDGAAYERFMGPWTRAIGSVFLDWLSIPMGQRWLEVGCGTGSFTELLIETAAPSSVIAIDPAPAQIEQARAKPVSRHADFRVADAQALPFADREFDVVASALVINFIPNRVRAVAEMNRVVKLDGCVAAYVWDFTGELGAARHIFAALHDANATVPPITGAESSRIEALRRLFEGAQLNDVETRQIDVTVAHPSFDIYWQRFLDNPSPTSIYIKELPERTRNSLRAAVHSRLPIAADGTITFAARANAVRGRTVGP